MSVVSNFVYVLIFVNLYGYDGRSYPRDNVIMVASAFFYLAVLKSDRCFATWMTASIIRPLEAVWRSHNVPRYISVVDGKLYGKETHVKVSSEAE